MTLTHTVSLSETMSETLATLDVYSWEMCTNPEIEILDDDEEVLFEGISLTKHP